MNGDLLAELMTLVSDPHLTWPEARARLRLLLNDELQQREQPGFERCPECGNLAMNPLPSCSACGTAAAPEEEHAFYEQLNRKA